MAGYTVYDPTAPVGGGGGGDMYKITYDPTTKNGDAFSQDNMADGTTNKNYTATEKTKLAAISGTNTGDQTITLTGDVTGSGTGSFATAIGTGVVVNADVSASAAIGLSKLAATTVSRALVSDASGFVSPATTTATEIGYVNGVTSAIQTQLNAKTSNTGTVTSVGVTVPTGLSVAGSPITTTGTAAITYTAGYQGYTTTEATKLSGIATAATANSTDATLLARANHTGTQAESTVTNLVTDLAAKAPIASPTFTGITTSAAEAITNTSGTLSITATTDGGDFNIYHSAGGTKTLAIYGTGGNTMNVSILDGTLDIGGVLVPTISSTSTLTNKRINPRNGTTTSSATPTINTDNVDFYSLTAQAVDITSFTTNLSGTPVEGQKLWVAITGTAARAITWGASFEASTIALPVTTVTTARLDVGFIWNSVTSKWRCVGAV